MSTFRLADTGFVDEVLDVSVIGGGFFRILEVEMRFVCLRQAMYL